MSHSPKDWFSYIESPIVLDNPDDENWHDQADVLVVGFGGAGATAAIKARDDGASVIAFDRYDGGGASQQSGGIVYLGGSTPTQQAAGVEDDTEEMFKYLKLETQGVIKDETLKRFCDNSADMHQWLNQQGVQFDASLCPMKTSYPSDKYYLYYSGNEPVAEYAEVAKPAQRGHRSYGKGMSGPAFYNPLKRSALEKGVRLLSQSRVSRLLQNSAGEVIGVEVFHIPSSNPMAAKHSKLVERSNKLRLVAPLLDRVRKQIQAIEKEHAEKMWVRANKGVILSAGGFVFNRKMVKHYAPKFHKAMPLGTKNCDGSGIHLGMSVDGDIDRMHQVSAWRFINPPMAWAQGMVVNDDGLRYCNEQVYGAKLGFHMVEENGGRATIILNGELYKKALREALPWKIWSFQAFPAYLSMFFNTKRGKTIEDLAANCKIPKENLLQTLNSYNEAAKGQKEDDFRKSKDFMFDMSKGPYYAMDVSVDSTLFPCPSITLGGLKVNEETGQVLNKDGESIVGLYAAGRNAIGVASNFYMSGLSLADCVFSGLRAGTHSAARNK